MILPLQGWAVNRAKPFVEVYHLQGGMLRQNGYRLLLESMY